MLSFFSILDKKFTDLVIQPSRKRNEYSAFCQMVDIFQTDSPVIYLADRGYASYNVFAHVIEKGQFFLIHSTDVKTGKILGFSLDGVKELDNMWTVFYPDLQQTFLHRVEYRSPAC